LRLEQAKIEHPPRLYRTGAVSRPLESGRGALANALTRGEGVRVIAELKRRSPSKGVLREDYDPAGIAHLYAASGAAAISVITEEDFFDGSIGDLRAVRAALPGLPLLRKDFVFDEYQLFEAASAGASAVLLIVAILDDELLKGLIETAAELGLDALVEVHAENELERALRAGASLIGVNNRDLTSFAVDLAVSFRIAALAPKNALLVSESGIQEREPIEQLRRAGYHGFLIGEHLMRSENPGKALRELLGAG
jgi:indole-3-glycerol phosphate synthase